MPWWRAAVLASGLSAILPAARASFEYVGVPKVLLPSGDCVQVGPLAASLLSCAVSSAQAAGGPAEPYVRFCQDHGGLTRVPVAATFWCRVGRSERNLSVAVATLPISGLPRGQSGVVLAWNMALDVRAPRPTVQWVEAVATKPGHRCLEIGWQVAGEDRGVVDRLCYSRADNSLPQSPADSVPYTDSTIGKIHAGLNPTRGMRARIFGAAEDATYAYRAGTGGQPARDDYAEKTLFDRLGRIGRISGKVLGAF